MSKMQNGSDALFCGHETGGCVGIMSVYNFTIGGKINAETLDDAVDILKLILEDQGIKVNQIGIFGIGEDVTECKKK